jgi:hypothetical protein
LKSSRQRPKRRHNLTTVVQKISLRKAGMKRKMSWMPSLKLKKRRTREERNGSKSKQLKMLTRQRSKRQKKSKNLLNLS